MLKFKTGEAPNLFFRKAMKKPIPISCIAILQGFEVETLEGTMKGNAGDYLMMGVNGELYPCAKEIFEKTYDFMD